MTPPRRCRLDPPWYLVTEDDFEACFVVGLEQDPDAACNVDVEVVLSDGSRWGATLVTLAEVHRMMARSAYFWCPETVIVRDPGVAGMTAVITGLLRKDDLRHVFRRLPD